MIDREIPCPVCGEDFKSYLDLARHMVQKDRPNQGEHIECLEMITGKPFKVFGWGEDKKIAIALRTYWKKNKSWPCNQ